ncbi:MAG: hypothetical protein V1820_03190 [archaeon]
MGGAIKKGKGTLGKILILSVLLFSGLLLAGCISASSDPNAPASGELVDKGKEFAQGTFGPLFSVFNFFGVGISNTADLLQFFAAFILISFTISQISPENSQIASFIVSVMLIGFIQFLLKLDWYTFLIHFAPAVFCYFVTCDILGFFSLISQRTAKWVGFFVMILIFWTDATMFYEEGAFSFFFSKFFSSVYSKWLNPYTIITGVILLTVARSFVVVSGSLKALAARKYQAAFRSGSGYAQQELIRSGQLGGGV